MRARGSMIWMVVGVVGATSLSACKKEPPPPPSAPSASDAGEMASTVTIDPSLFESGRVAVARVEKRAPRGSWTAPAEARSGEGDSAEAGTLVTGRVAQVLAREGRHVTRGEILAWVDAPEVARAAADVVRARARAEVASRKLERLRELEKQQATAAALVDEARAESEIARADLLAARTLLTNLGATEPPDGDGAKALAVRVPVRSPIDGVVVHRDAVVGSPVSPDRSLFRVVGGNRPYVVARIAETAPRPDPGSHALLSARGDASAPCAATVVGALGEIDPASRTLPIRLEPDADCPIFAPGSWLEARFESSGDGAARLVVPREAITEVDGHDLAFVRRASTAVFDVRRVQLGPGSGADAVVTDGLHEGEEVAVRGVVLLKGELVKSQLEGAPP